MTGLVDLFQRAPARVLFPDVEPGEPPQAVLLTTSGGLTGGDRLRLGLDVGAGAAATFSTQAAEKIYRALDDEVRIETRVTVGAGAWAEWLAQETILFEGARLRRLLTADVAPGGRLLAVESVVLGRGAMGESLTTGLLNDQWRIHRDGRLIWADGLHLSGDIAGARGLPFGFGAAAACATLVLVAEDASDHLDAARDMLGGGGVRAGATTFDGMLIVRILAEDPAGMRRAVIRVAGGLRERAGGLPPLLPRVWHC